MTIGPVRSLADVVREKVDAAGGPVEALRRIDLGIQASRSLQAQYARRGWHHAALGQQAAAEGLRREAFALVEAYA